MKVTKHKETVKTVLHIHGKDNQKFKQSVSVNAKAATLELHSQLTEQKKVSHWDKIYTTEDAETKAAADFIDAETLQKVVQGKTCTIMSAGLNASRGNNYNRHEVMKHALKSLNEQLVDDPDYFTHVSYACVGFSDRHCVDLISEKTISPKRLESGLPEALYNSVNGSKSASSDGAADLKLDSVVKWMDNGFSLPGFVLSVKIERIPQSTMLRIKDDMENHRNVYGSLVSVQQEDGLIPSTGYLHLVNFGAVRMNLEGTAATSVPSCSHVFRIVRTCLDSRYSRLDAETPVPLHLGLLFFNLFCSSNINSLFWCDFEIDNPVFSAKEVELLCDFISILQPRRNLVSKNLFDDKLAILLQLESHLRAYKKKLREERDKCDQLSSDLREHIHEKSQLESQHVTQIKKLEEKINELTGQQEEESLKLRAQTAVAEDKTRYLEKQLHEKDVSIKEWETKYQELESQLTTTQKNVEEYNQTIEQLRKEMDGITKETSSKDKDAEKLFQKFQESQEIIKELKDELKDMRSSANSSNKEKNSEYQAAKKSYEREIKDWQTQCTKFEKLNAKLESQLEKRDEEIETLKTELKEIKKELSQEKKLKDEARERELEAKNRLVEAKLALPLVQTSLPLADTVVEEVKPKPQEKKKPKKKSKPEPEPEMEEPVADEVDMELDEPVEEEQKSEPEKSEVEEEAEEEVPEVKLKTRKAQTATSKASKKPKRKAETQRIKRKKEKEPVVSEQEVEENEKENVELKSEEPPKKKKLFKKESLGVSSSTKQEADTTVTSSTAAVANAAAESSLINPDALKMVKATFNLSGMFKKK